MSEDRERAAHPTPMSRAELLGVLAFWTMLAVLTAANRLADQREFGVSVVSRTIPIALAFQQMYTWALLTPLVFWLAGRFSIDTQLQVRGFQAGPVDSSAFCAGR